MRARQPDLDVPNEVLAEIFATASVRDEAGERHPLRANISIAHANALYRTVLDRRPQTVVEVGMAYGVASLAIATALRNGGGGQLISIDPSQSDQWKRIGVLNVQRAGLEGHHHLVERSDYRALPQLLEQRRTIQFGYIDGWHTFDYTLLDFFYVDKLLDVGGVVAFNDCGLPSVSRVVRYVSSHRKYRPLDVGLRRSYFTRDLRTSVARLATLRSKADRYFEKLERWEPGHDFYARF